MSGRNKKTNPTGKDFWIKLLCGFLGILMVLGTVVMVLSTFEMHAEDDKTAKTETSEQISVGIAYGNDLLPTYTVTADGGFSIGIPTQNNKKEIFEYDAKKISVAVCDNLYKSSLGYESNPDRLTAIGGYHLQVSSFSFKTGSDVSGDNPVSFFPGASSGAGSGAIVGYTKSAVYEKIEDLNKSGILEQNNVYAYPVYNNGMYFIRIGDFSTEDEVGLLKDSLSKNLSLNSSIISPGDGSVSIVDYESDRILISFLGNENRPICVTPRTGNSFGDNDSTSYYGHMDFEFINGKFSVINTLSLEDYIKCILPINVSYKNDIQFLKLFSVILRTKAMYNSSLHEEHGFDVCTGFHCSAYHGRNFENTITSEAVDATKSVVITYDGKPINPVYNVAAGATTASCIDVFGKDVPYLRAVSKADKEFDQWTFTKTQNDIYNALVSAGYTEVKANVDSIKINSYGEGSEYVTSVTFTDILGNTLTVEGSDKIFKALGSALPSTAFCVGKAGETVQKITYVNGERTTESIHLEGKYGEFVFVGCGSGNGLGLSYMGALEDISSGMTYADVISKYYSGVKLS